MYKIIASFFGVGFIKKGAGTAAAFIVCALLYMSVQLHVSSYSWLSFLAVLVLFTGVIASKEAERSWGKDSNKIVIDEVFGMIVSLLFLPIHLKTLITGFVLFRFFDIAKPLYIRRFENFKNGWGVMLDDLLAGVYANIVLQLLLLTGLLQ